MVGVTSRACEDMVVVLEAQERDWSHYICDQGCELCLTSAKFLVNNFLFTQTRIALFLSFNPKITRVSFYEVYDPRV